MPSILFSETNLKGLSLEKRADAISKTLKISKEELAAYSVKSGEDEGKKIEEALSFLLSRLPQIGIIGINASDISEHLIGSLVYSDLDTISAAQRVSSRITAVRKNLRKLRMQSAGDTNKPYKKPKSNEGQLETIVTPPYVDAALQIWGNSIKFSPRDLRKGIKLPEDISVYVAAVLGTICPSARPVGYPSFMIPKRYSLDIFQVLKKSYLDLFNLEFNNPNNMKLNSEVVHQFLVDKLKMAIAINDRNVVDFEAVTQSSDETVRFLNEAFLYGVISMVGKLFVNVHNQKEPDVEIYTDFGRNDNLKIKIYELSDQVGVTAIPSPYWGNIRKPGTKFHYESAAVLKIMGSKVFDSGFPHKHIGGFFNPKHLEELAKLPLPYKPLPKHSRAS